MDTKFIYLYTYRKFLSVNFYAILQDQKSMCNLYQGENIYNVLKSVHCF